MPQTGPAVIDGEASGWGRYPVAPCRILQPSTLAEAARVTGDAAAPLLARGNGRSYGDSSLGPGLTLDTRKMDRVLAFSQDTGLIRCEAGLLLSDLIDCFLPQGFFVPVTPGTTMVTVGGMVASDVHGKNHHRDGSFCDHVEALDLSLGDGRVLTCTRQEYADLFAATCGGMGLTGIILTVTFRLRRVETAFIRQTTLRARSLEEAMATFDAVGDATYSVAWIDGLAQGRSLGRSVVLTGEHATAAELPPRYAPAPLDRARRRNRSVPVDLPRFALNSLSVRAFNTVYYHAQRARNAIVPLDTYFYPLDALHDWNRIYGRRGFVQYQCVIPPGASRDGLTRLLTEIAARGNASFLAVLKSMGRQSFGLLSFPEPGYTLALDFAVSKQTFDLLDRLDEIVADHGGRIYLAKDARMSPRMMGAGYDRLEQFRAVRHDWGLTSRFRSRQSDRLGV